MGRAYQKNIVKDFSIPKDIEKRGPSNREILLCMGHFAHPFSSKDRVLRDQRELSVSLYAGNWPKLKMWFDIF